MILDCASAFRERPAASKLDSIDPRCRVICAFCFAVAIAAVSDVKALALGSALPVFLLCVDGRGGLPRIARALVGVNKVSVLALIFLPLTYPGERMLVFFSADGAKMALIIIWRLNIISAVLIKMVASMGIGGVNGALTGLRVPLKLRTLLLLTARYAFLLADRMLAMTRAVGLRAPDIRGIPACGAYAGVVGATLVHSADRAERSALAIECRGGMSGFSQSRARAWTRRESALCAALLLYLACLACLETVAVL
jgi:energy-coupling factor transporter transmembrane protein EcfT